MQYIKELSTGIRVSVDQAQFVKDSMGPNKCDLVFFLRSKSATIYHMNGPAYRTPQLNIPKYGGRGRAMRRGNLQYCGG